MSRQSRATGMNSAFRFYTLMLIDAGDSLLARLMPLPKGNSLQKLHHTHSTHILVHILRFSRMLFQKAIVF